MSEVVSVPPAALLRQGLGAACVLALLALFAAAWGPAAPGVHLGVAALCALAVGVATGWVARPRERDRQPAVPWFELGAGAVLQAGGAGFALGVAHLAGAPSPLGPGGWFFVSLAGPWALLAAGGLVGTFASRPAVVPGGVVAWAIWAGVSFVGARRVFFDPDVIVAVTLISTLVGTVGVGAGMAAFQRKMGFPEAALAGLLIAFAVYFGVAVAPDELAAAVNAPVPQILVAFALFPPLVLVAFLTVGSSLGFLLFGGGRFDPRFGVELKMALRYIRAQSRTAVVGIVTVFAIGGVALGVTATIVVLSIMSGFEHDLKTKILSAHSHLMITKHGDDFLEYVDVERRAGALAGVKTAAAFVLGDAMISTDVGLSGTLVKGLDPRRPSGLAALQQSLQQGSITHLLEPERIPGNCPKGLWSRTSTVAGAEGPRMLEAPAVLDRAECGRVLPGIILGKELSRSLRAYVGDRVKLVSPTSDELGPMGPVPKLRSFRVAGIVFTGMYEYDAKFSYLAMEDAQRFFGLRDRATGVELKLDDLDQTSWVASSLVDALGGEPYVVQDWREMNKELFSALLLEKIAMFVALTMIVMVASFLIVATLVMIVLQRGKEIAILKSLGASDSTVMKVFVLQGLIIGLVGATLGVLAGVGVCRWLQTYGFKLDDSVFYIEKLPVVLDSTEVTVIAVAAVTISYLATIYPAMTAAKLDPVEGLRDD